MESQSVSLRYDKGFLRKDARVEAPIKTKHESNSSETLRAMLGFACNQGFVFSLFYMGANRAVHTGAFSFERADLFGTLLFMLVSFLFLRIVSPKVRSTLLARPLVWGYSLLLVVGSIISSWWGAASSLAILCESALVGFPAGLMLAAWGRVLGEQAVPRAVPTVFLASALGATACFMVAATTIPEALFLLKLLPLGSAWALWSLGNSAGIPSSFASSALVVEAVGKGADASGGKRSSLSLRMLLATAAERRQAAQLSSRIIMGTVLFGLAAGFMETYGSDPGMASTPTLPATLLLFVIFCIAALQLLAAGGLGVGLLRRKGGGSAIAATNKQDSLGPEGPLDNVYRLAALVMMAGFLFVPVLSDFGVPGEAIVLAGYLGLSAVLISLFLVMARITGQDAAVSFARGFMALFAGELVGIALGNVIDVVAGTEQTPYVVVACAGLAALYAYLFLFTERDFRALSVIVEDADRFEDACELIAQEHGLSKREAEILPFALKGRTGERIASEFFISKSTVDTHLRRIYGKCKVHGRQELIDLGERVERQLTSGEQ